MTDDSELLRRYAKDRSEAAFTELVRRHLSFVYRIARIRLGADCHLAEDVTQTVFLSLARKASSLWDRPSLAGWLCKATRYAAINVARAETRRKEREARVIRERVTEPDWNRLEPVLMEALDRLPLCDREAVLLRFFANRPYSEIGQTLKITENSARKRVDRALEKLRVILGRDGIASTATALSAAMAACPAYAAPINLEAAIVAGASSVPLNGAYGFCYFMTATKSILGGTAFLAIATILSLLSDSVESHELLHYQAAHTAITATAALVESVQDQLRALGRSSRALESRLASLRTEHDRQITNRPRPLPRATAQPPPRGTLAGWKQFASLHPEATQMMRQALQDEFNRDYSVFFLREGLSPAQMQEFESETLNYQMQNLAAGPGTPPWPTAMQLPDDQLRQILGDQGFQDLKAYLDVGFANLDAVTLGAAIGYVAPPVSGEQEVQLAQLIADNSSSYRSGQGLNSRRDVDWAAVEAEAKQLLTPVQFEAADVIFLARQSDQALESARQAQIHSASAAP